MLSTLLELLDVILVTNSALVITRRMNLVSFDIVDGIRFGIERWSCGAFFLLYDDFVSHFYVLGLNSSSPVKISLLLEPLRIVT